MVLPRVAGDGVLREKVAGLGRRSSGFDQIGDQIVSVLLFFETSKHHLGSGDVFLWVLQISIQRLSGPCDTFVFVRFGVIISFRLSSFATDQAVQIWSSFMFTASFDSVALVTSLLKDFSANFGRHFERK